MLSRSDHERASKCAPWSSTEDLDRVAELESIELIIGFCVSVKDLNYASKEYPDSPQRKVSCCRQASSVRLFGRDIRFLLDDPGISCEKVPSIPIEYHDLALVETKDIGL